MAINKQIDLRFVMGYSPLEFRDTLHMLAEGRVDAAGLVTGSVGLAGVESAFAALADPEQHAKIVIEPALEAAVPTPRIGKEQIDQVAADLAELSTRRRFTR